MWKLILVEVLGNLSWLLGLFFVVILFVIGFYCGYCMDEGKKIRMRKVKVLFASAIFCISITILMPSKKFMYTVLGINETLDFIQNNEEAKKISSKTLQLINKKLDNYLTEEEK